jgi:hypothetical protein
MKCGREQHAMSAGVGECDQVRRSPHAAAGDQAHVGKGDARGAQRLEIRPCARAHLEQGQQDDLSDSFVDEQLKRGERRPAVERWASAEDAVGAHVDADQHLAGRHGVADRSQVRQVGQRLGADDHPRGPSLEQPGGDLRVADARVYPRLRPQSITQLADHTQMVTCAGDGVEVGDVESPTVALAAQSSRDGQGIAAGHEPAAHGAVVLAFAAQALHHATAHQV